MGTETKEGGRRGVMVGVFGGVVILALAACGHMGMLVGGNAERPPEEEFGLGPRASVAGLYQATLEPEAPLRVRAMQSVRLVVLGADGRAVERAEIVVDGGMPEHGHGLPTRPRVTRSLGAGAYEVEGVRFNMGGWWELKFEIAGVAGRDTVVFNLDL